MALTEPITYDNECSCALNANCTTQAGFISSNSSDIIPIKGLNMGCTPTESLLASTLECFYDLSCINLIREHITFTNSAKTVYTTPLSVNDNRFPPDKLIIDLAGDLFVETWSTKITYTDYFNRCLPTSCSYTYVQQLNSLYTGTVLLGLYGGLNVVLQGICRTIIYLLFKIYQFRKRRSNLVDGGHSIEIATIGNASASKSTTAVSAHQYGATLDTSTASRAPYFYCRSIHGSVIQRSLIVVTVVLIILAAMVIGPSVYLFQQAKSEILRTSMIIHVYCIPLLVEKI